MIVFDRIQSEYGLRKKIRFEFAIISQISILAGVYFEPLQGWDLCYFARYPEKIGGPGKIVEIDETCVSKQNTKEGEWSAQTNGCLGDGEGDEECLPGPCRCKRCPNPFDNHPRLDIILSDMWKAYGGITNLPAGYQLLMVNHSLNFVDRKTGAHTQNVENMRMRFVVFRPGFLSVVTPGNNTFGPFFKFPLCQ